MAHIQLKWYKNKNLGKIKFIHQLSNSRCQYTHRNNEVVITDHTSGMLELQFLLLQNQRT